jgi:hypothetical protein
MYSGNPSATDPHLQLEWDIYYNPERTPPMVSDAHYYSTDGKVNGIRSNFPHANVKYGKKLPCNGSTRYWFYIRIYVVFEPIGWIQRWYCPYVFFILQLDMKILFQVIIFQCLITPLERFLLRFLAQLLLFGRPNQDPVSAREIIRNNAIYASQK